MGISRQIGWTEKEKLLYEIYNKLKRANGLAYKWTQGDFFQQGAKLNSLPSEDSITFEGDTEPLTFEGDTENITFELIEN